MNLTAPRLLREDTTSTAGSAARSDDVQMRRAPIPRREPCGAVRVYPTGETTDRGPGQEMLPLVFPDSFPLPTSPTSHLGTDAVLIGKFTRHGGISSPAGTPAASRPQGRPPVETAGVTWGAAPEGKDPSGRSTCDELPEARSWASSFIQAAMEVAGGVRPPAQLVRWTTPEVHGQLLRRGTLASRALRLGRAMSTTPQVRAVLLCSPQSGVYEVSAVVAEPQRVRAVAFRMEALHNRWRVTELEMQGRSET